MRPFSREMFILIVETATFGVMKILSTRHQKGFQHHGSDAHFDENERWYLDQRYPRQRIGRSGPRASFSRFQSLDFFLWGYLKSKIFETTVRKQEDVLE